jgi:MSHA pilin protein MshD
MCIHNGRGERGLSLVELIVFIVVVSVAVAGVLGVINYTTRASVDPVIQKQALAIAEAVLEEVQSMPFTYCDPDDANITTAVNAAGCAAAAEGLGPEAVDVPPTGPAETRIGGARPFDNVNDYNGFSMTGITDIAGNAIGGLGAYTASVAVTAAGMPGFGGAPAIPGNEALLITVTVSHSSLSSGLVLHGYRTRYAPNALP